MDPNILLPLVLRAQKKDPLVVNPGLLAVSPQEVMQHLPLHAGLQYVLQKGAVL